MRGVAYTLGGTPRPLYSQKATANNCFLLFHVKHLPISYSMMPPGHQALCPRFARNHSGQRQRTTIAVTVVPAEVHIRAAVCSIIQPRRLLAINHVVEEILLNNNLPVNIAVGR